ncbi:hypothetical protein [Crocosphaera sp.]|nr:hypothetical protein [Crocosphaera sp.]
MLQELVSVSVTASEKVASFSTEIAPPISSVSISTSSSFSSSKF